MAIRASMSPRAMSGASDRCEREGTGVALGDGEDGRAAEAVTRGLSLVRLTGSTGADLRKRCFETSSRAAPGHATKVGPLSWVGLGSLPAPHRTAPERIESDRIGSRDDGVALPTAPHGPFRGRPA